MNKFYGLIERLINLSLTHNLIEEDDRIYSRNRLLALFNEAEFEVSLIPDSDLYETLDALSELAVQKGLIEDTLQMKDIFSSTLMDVFMDKPSVVNAKFFEYYNESPEKATDYFYKLSRNVNYVKVDRIAKNKEFEVDSPYGKIALTINLSKPEKDPKQIALEKLAPPNKYPSCLLCVENEGYKGTIKLPDRANHRLIHLSLNQRDWMLQYSPYLYYNEHCIILSAQHVPMKIDTQSFSNLLDFIDMFPHYFIGSNADLPIVGGSILSHEHYQGGCYTFPINHASKLFSFTLNDFADITAEAVNWPLSTLRLSSLNKASLVKASSMILALWRNYSDSDLDILSHSGDTPHNTITPITRREGKNFVIDLVLRNNRTTDEHPLGLFHPHADVHHVKKENIGLIEVMGLAILPGRLLEELEDIKLYINNKPSLVKDYHLSWADELKGKYDGTSDLDAFMMQALGDKFTRVLEDAGVYKLNDTGVLGFKKFVSTFAEMRNDK